MSKLIRIDSVRDDGRFLPNFTTDIKLKENASIALKDLCFEPEFQVVNVNATNNEITTKPVDGDGASDILTQRVEPAIYNFKDQFRLAQEVTNALNLTLGIGKTAPQFSQFSSYRVRSEGENGDPDSRLEVQLRISPVLEVVGKTSTGIDFFHENEGGFGSNWLETDTSIVGRTILDQDVANVDDDRYRLIPLKGIGLSKGNGMFCAQIYNSVASGGFTDFNGFKLGLTLEKKNDKISDANTTNPRLDPAIQNEDIPSTALNFEIDFRETGLPYRFRSGGLKSSPTLQTSAVNPHLMATGTATTNDIVMIKVNTFNDRKVIEGVVLQHTGAGPSGVENVLFRYTLTNADIGNEFGAEHDPDDLDTIFFTPYIVFRGKKDRCRINNVLFTPDVNADISVAHNALPRDSPYFPLKNDNTLMDTCAATFQNVIPQTAQQFDYEFEEMINVDVATSSITITDELGEGLGLGSRNKDANDNEYTFINQRFLRQDEDPNFHMIDPRIFGIVGAKFPFQNPPPSSGDDYFLVELNNLNLDSYSSIPNENLVRNTYDNRTNQGERKNIVATIPVENQAFGQRVTYEPNELNYIAIKNSETTNLRNLQIRILHPDYTEVETYGRSHVCLYVKD
jgi:hypothetical protein